MSNDKLDKCGDVREPGKLGLLRVLAREGRIAFRQTTLDEFKALLGPPTQESSSQDDLLERIHLTYPGLPHYTASRAELVETARDLFDVVVSGAVKIEIGQSYPLAEAAQAHRDLESRRTTGSTILVP